MDSNIEYLKNINWQTIIAIIPIMWYFTHDIREKLTNLERDVKQQGARTDKIYEMILDHRKEVAASALEERKNALEERKNVLQMIQNIQNEMKEFHQKLYAIEERRKNN